RSRGVTPEPGGDGTSTGGEGGGNGSGSQRGGGSGTGQRKTRGRARVTLLDEGRRVEANGQTFLIAPFVVTHAEGAQATRVRARVGVVLDGNQLENEPPAGGQQPRLLRWRDAEQGI